MNSNEPRNPVANDLMIVNRQNPNRPGLRAHDFLSVSFSTNFPANFSANHDRLRPSAVASAFAAGTLRSTSAPESRSLHTVIFPPQRLPPSRPPPIPSHPG